MRGRDVLRRQPLDPQPQDVHPHGKPGRRLPPPEPQGEYLTGGVWGWRGVLSCTAHGIRTVRDGKAEEQPIPRNSQAFAPAWEQR